MNSALACDCKAVEPTVDSDGRCFTCAGAIGQPTEALRQVYAAYLANQVQSPVTEVRTIIHDYFRADGLKPGSAEIKADRLAAKIEAHFDRRATELLEANNREVERRRKAEAEIEAGRAAAERVRVRELGRMVKIDDLIQQLSDIRRQFGNTWVYIRPEGMGWGAVALNWQHDDQAALGAQSAAQPAAEPFVPQQLPMPPYRYQQDGGPTPPAAGAGETEGGR